MKSKSLQNLLEAVGAELATLRKNKGYKTIKEFAAAFKLPAIQYWRIENGKTNPTLSSLDKLLKIHKMTIPDFFCEIEMAQRKSKSN